MRSKEVEDNINLLITYRGNLWQQHKAPKITKAIDKTITYIEDLEEENADAKKYADDVWRKQEELKSDLKYVLEQTLGAFQHNWCIDWNFTEIREKYNL